MLFLLFHLKSIDYKWNWCYGGVAKAPFFVISYQINGLLVWWKPMPSYWNSSSCFSGCLNCLFLDSKNSKKPFLWTCKIQAAWISRVKAHGLRVDCVGGCNRQTHQPTPQMRQKRDFGAKYALWYALKRLFRLPEFCYHASARLSSLSEWLNFLTCTRTRVSVSLNTKK